MDRLVGISRPYGEVGLGDSQAFAEGSKVGPRRVGWWSDALGHFVDITSDADLAQGRSGRFRPSASDAWSFGQPAPLCVFPVTSWTDPHVVLAVTLGVGRMTVNTATGRATTTQYRTSARPLIVLC
jgi:hypothetical protein